MAPPGRVLADRYRLLEPIGEGGMAVVHRGHDELLDRDVAIKLLRAAYAEDPAFVRRFRSEARHAAALHDPRIVTIFDGGVDPTTGADYIVMQLVHGPTLEAILAERGRLPLGEALRIATETAEALQVAHERGIVHRDVKPGNILIDQDGSVRVADFGIARAAGDGGATTSGVVIGSPYYVSPEQVDGEPVTPASDIFSLGVVLYEMITGVRPYDGPSAAAIALQRLRRPPRPPSAIQPDVPADLDAIVMRAMERNPARRFPSAAELAVALDGFRLVHLGGVRRDGSRARPAAEALAPVDVNAPALAPTRIVGAARQRQREARRWAPAGAAVAGAATAGAATSAVRPASPPTLRRRAAPVHEDRDRRRAVPLPFLLPVAAVILVLVAASLLVRGLGSSAARPGDSPAASAIAAAPSASPSASAAAIVLAPSVASPSRAPSSSPSPTTAPARTPTPTPPPTPRPTPRPTLAPAAASSRDPAETVRRFYELVVAHRFEEAARLWSPRMREQYPPKQYIDGRFAPTTAIEIRRLAITSESVVRRTATVAVDLIERRQDGSTRHWVGSWDLVLTSAGWLMDQPHF